jgi:hypothetical protein
MICSSEELCDFISKLSKLSMLCTSQASRSVGVYRALSDSYTHSLITHVALMDSVLMQCSNAT